VERLVVDLQPETTKNQLRRILELEDFRYGDFFWSKNLGREGGGGEVDGGGRGLQWRGVADGGDVKSEGAANNPRTKRAGGEADATATSEGGMCSKRAEAKRRPAAWDRTGTPASPASAQKRRSADGHGGRAQGAGVAPQPRGVGRTGWGGGGWEKLRGREEWGAGTPHSRTSVRPRLHEGGGTFGTSERRHRKARAEGGGWRRGSSTRPPATPRRTISPAMTGEGGDSLWET
jgi:hypothetical protein